jgi:putative molybdopterin biosynthesis protein
MKQEQFLNVIDRDEAEKRFHAVLDLRPLAGETVPLNQALGRILGEDVVAPVDVPSFDRSNVDGFAVRAEDTFGASEERPRTLALTEEVLGTGITPATTVTPGRATTIATGAVVPRGADAIVMIEHTDIVDGEPDASGPIKDDARRSPLADGRSVLLIRRPVTPGSNISFAGTDIGRGETVYRRGDLLTSRETGVLAAIGLASVSVVRRPRVAIVSTGNEIILPGRAMRPGLVFDSNATILADAVRELGGEPIPMGIVPDDRDALETVLRRALGVDVVLLSGGTSKGEGDLSYRVVGGLGSPGIVAHGVALKPGKPLCLAAIRVPAPDRASGSRIVAVVILPGFPTSAIFTFHEFVAPVIQRLGGRRPEPVDVLQARLPGRISSERGRTEYLLVGLVKSGQSWAAYPMGKGSGSVTAFSRADGFVVIPRQQEFLEAGSTVNVRLLGRGIQPADLVVIGSHCVGLDYLLGRLHERGFRTKFLAVGSMGGLAAARREECDLAGIHLLDGATNAYNVPFVSPDLVLLRGYGRTQGIVFRPHDTRFENYSVSEAISNAVADPACIMVNRNAGSGTRLLIDQLLGGTRPLGYLNEARSHNAVAAAVAQGRVDWGVTISTVARDLGLGLIPVREECYDFVVPRIRLENPAVMAFRAILDAAETREHLVKLEFRLLPPLDNRSVTT